MEQYKEQVRAAAANADRYSPLDSTLVIVLLRNVYDWNVGACHNKRAELSQLSPLLAPVSSSGTSMTGPRRCDGCRTTRRRTST